jgi:hypothetical protein
MDTILCLITGLGFVGSLAFLGWGMSLCLRHGVGEYAYGRQRGHGQGALGSFAEPQARPAPGL